MTPKIFVSQEGNFDYSYAEEYGEVVFLSVDEFSMLPSSLKNEKIVNHMKKLMVDYIPGNDFLLPSGNPIAIGIMFSLASTKGDNHNILKWDRASNGYRKTMINWSY